MKGSRLKQALYYQLSDFGWSSLYVYGITAAIVVAIGFLVTTSTSESGIDFGIGIVGFVHLLIVGIDGIREYLRFFLQHGIGRSTIFFSNLFASLICSIALGLFCELFNLFTGYWFSDAVFGHAFAVRGLIVGWMLHAVFFFFAWQVGAMISLIYYRLNKVQQSVFSVASIATIILAFSGGIRRLASASDEFVDMIQRAVDNPLGLTSIVFWAVLALGILSAVGSYLLIRRVHVRE